MISISVYKIVHLLSLFVLFSVAGAVAVHAANGGTRKGNAARGLVAGLHGFSLVFLLVSGFGMLARLDVEHNWLFPGWIWGKIAIWALFAVLVLLPYRRSALAKPLFLLAPILGALAALLAIWKPF